MHTVLMITDNPEWWAKVWQIAGCDIVTVGRHPREARGVNTKIVFIRDSEALQGYVPDEFVVDTRFEMPELLAAEIKFRSDCYDAEIKYL